MYAEMCGGGMQKAEEDVSVVKRWKGRAEVGLNRDERSCKNYDEGGGW